MSKIPAELVDLDWPKISNSKLVSTQPLLPRLVTDQGAKGSAVAHASNNAVSLAAFAAKLAEEQPIDWSKCATAATSQIATAGITRKTLADGIKAMRNSGKTAFQRELLQELPSSPIVFTRFDADYLGDFNNERHSGQMLKGVELEAALDKMYRTQNPEPYADITDMFGHLGRVDVENQCFRFNQRHSYPDLSQARVDVRSLRALKGRRFDFSLCEEIYSLLHDCGIYIGDGLKTWESIHGDYELSFEKPTASKANVNVELGLFMFQTIFTSIAYGCATNGIDSFVFSSFFIAKAKTRKDLSKARLASARSQALRERDVSRQNEHSVLAVNSELRQKIDAYEAEIARLKATSLEKISAARLTGYKPKRKVTRLPAK